MYNKTVTRKYEIESKKIVGNVKIVMISDLHSIPQKNGFKKLFERINSENPDMLILAGDIFDVKRNDSGAVSFLEHIPENIPTFYVTGNHEHKTGKLDLYINTLEKFGVCVLDCTKAKLDIRGNSFCVCGISDMRKKDHDDVNYDFQKEIKNKFSDNGNGFNILAAHNPFFVDDYLKGDFDLILSGHTHGGQVRIPFLINGLYNRSAGFFPPYCGGVYKHGNVYHVVGRGVSNNPRWCPRIFNRKEVVSVTLKPCK